MPWRECSVTEERLRFVARVLEGEAMSEDDGRLLDADGAPGIDVSPVVRDAEVIEVLNLMCLAVMLGQDNVPVEGSNLMMATVRDSVSVSSCQSECGGRA